MCCRNKKFWKLLIWYEDEVVHAVFGKSWMAYSTVFLFGECPSVKDMEHEEVWNITQDGKVQRRLLHWKKNICRFMLGQQVYLDSRWRFGGLCQSNRNEHHNIRLTLQTHWEYRKNAHSLDNSYLVLNLYRVG